MEIDNGRPPCESQLLYATCKYHYIRRFDIRWTPKGKCHLVMIFGNWCPRREIIGINNYEWIAKSVACGLTSWFAQPGEFSERRFKISSHAHRERTSWEVRDCDKKEGIAGNRNTWGNMANTSPASVIAPSTRTVIIGVDDSCFSEYAFNCEYN